VLGPQVLQVGLPGAAFTYLGAPLLALALVGVLAVALRWTFARGKSVVAPRARAGASDDYGMLVVVSAPRTFVEAEASRARLVDAGIRATLAPTTDGPRVLVFPRDLDRAKGVLDGRG
jgi:hypothetical protein